MIERGSSLFVWMNPEKSWKNIELVSRMYEWCIVFNGCIVCIMKLCVVLGFSLSVRRPGINSPSLRRRQQRQRRRHPPAAAPAAPGGCSTTATRRTL